MIDEIRIPHIVTGGIDLMPTRRAANATASDLTAVPIDVEMLVLEQFPPALRRAFNEAATKLNCLAFVEHYNWAARHGLGISRTIGKLAEIERNDMLIFAGRHRAIYQYDLPHIAAQATIQRYGALGPSRHPPKRPGSPHFRAQKRRRRQ